MNANKAFSGSFLKAGDLEVGKDMVVTISTVTMEDLDDGPKMLISFSESNQKLVLNKTNGGILIELYGEETDNWEGKSIALYRTKVDYQGKRVDAIRVRDTLPGAAGNTGSAAPAATTDPVAILAWAKAAAKAGGAHADELAHYAANAGALAIGAGVPEEPIDDAPTPADQITAIAAAMKAVIQARAAVASQPEKIQF